MDRKAVNSGAIASVGYDPATETLEVEFPSKAVWRYFGFQQHSYDEFMRAESLGRFFAMFIRANFKSERVHADECGKYLECHVVNCECFCHKLTKSSKEHHEVPNPDLEPELRKSLKQTKKRKSNV